MTEPTDTSTDLPPPLICAHCAQPGDVDLGALQQMKGGLSAHLACIIQAQREKDEAGYKARLRESEARVTEARKEVPPGWVKADDDGVEGQDEVGIDPDNDGVVNRREKAFWVPAADGSERKVVEVDRRVKGGFASLPDVIKSSSTYDISAITKPLKRWLSVIGIGGIPLAIAIGIVIGWNMRGKVVETVEVPAPTVTVTQPWPEPEVKFSPHRGDSRSAITDFLQDGRGQFLSGQRERLQAAADKDNVVLVYKVMIGTDGKAQLVFVREEQP